MSNVAEISVGDIGSLGIDLGTVNTDNEYKPLPKGDYAARVSKAEIVTTKAGNTALKAEITLIGGKGIGKKKVWDYFTLVSTNDNAVSIGQKRLKGLLVAGGMSSEQVNGFSNSSDMIGLEVTVHLKIQSSEQYGDSNKVSFYKRYDESLATKVLADIEEDGEFDL